MLAVARVYAKIYQKIKKTPSLAQKIFFIKKCYQYVTKDVLEYF